ncbi:MAG: hypothetical protein ACI8Q2_000169, partial [Candidatus Omnitrophota bacterium]
PLFISRHTVDLARPNLSAISCTVFLSFSHTSILYRSDSLNASISTS